MHTPAETQAENGRPGLGTSVGSVSDHAKRLIGLEVELATWELKRKLAALGAGIALLVAAGLLGLYGLGFLFATIAAAFDTFLPRWLSLLIVTLLLFAVAGILALVARGRFRKGTPPVPEQAIEEARRTSEALKG